MALILNAIDPSIGGVLLTGPKGSGKSTLVRAASRIFPEVDVVDGCPFGCHPSDPMIMCEGCREKLETGKTIPKTKRPIRIVQIPIGATEDRVIGSLDLERVFSEGIKAIQPGILAEANQNILYLDEVNLLPDHIIDIILDAASSGWNVVEREGLSIAHPSRFMLIGTMNPEEGELRPQILDRFGLHAKTESMIDTAKRMEVVRRNLEFTMDPESFIRKYVKEDEALRIKVENARSLLPHIYVSNDVFQSVAKLHSALKVDGYRPDIITIRAAKAYAAYQGRLEVTSDDVRIASELTLTHRTRSSGLRSPLTLKEIHEALLKTPVGRSGLRSERRRLRLARATHEAKRLYKSRTIHRWVALASIIGLLVATVAFSYDSIVGFARQSPLLFASALLFTASIAALVLKHMSKPRQVPTVKLIDLSKITSLHARGGPQVVVEDSDTPVRVPTLAELEARRKTLLEEGEKGLTKAELPSKEAAPLHPKPTESSSSSRPRRGTQYLVGKRAKIVASSTRGRYVWHELPKDKPWDIALGPTLRAAAPFQQYRKGDGLAVVIKPEDIRIKMREYRAPFSIVLLVDMSLSMANSIINLGRAVFSLHRSVYRRRDRVSLVVFKGNEAVVLQQPTTNLDIVVQKLMKVGTSDFTPMAAGMLKAWRILQQEKQRNKDIIPMLIVVTDGIANIPLNQPLSSWGRISYMSKAQADAMDVAHLLRRSGVRTIVINTSHRRQEIPGESFVKLKSSADWFTPTEFLMEVARITGGSYYGLSLSQEPSAMIRKTKLEDWFYFEAEAQTD